MAVWLIALIGFFAIGRLTGSAYQNTSSLPGTDSAKALQVLRTDFPAQAGDSDRIVVQAKQGTLRSPGAETAVKSMLARVAKLPYVRSVTPPYAPGGRISTDGTIGLATVNLDASARRCCGEPSAGCSPRTGARSSRPEPSGAAGPKGSAAGR